MDSEAPPQTQRPVSAEEEALKRNTDCVYYLASPLTCKKGNECEFRHSEIARLNPRDCWFWVNGNCLNPKCGFRHPSLDGLMGAQAPASSGHSLSQTQTASKTSPYVPHASGKQPVPCVFFQKGYCLKGDWCPFLHAPSPTSNKTIQAPASASAPELATIKKDIGVLENSVQTEKPPSLPVKSAKQVLEPKPAYGVGTSNPRNESFVDGKVQRVLVTKEFPGFRNVAPCNGNLVDLSSLAQQSRPLDEPESMNSKEGEEVSREPSPGFDVLVDDDAMRDSDYYPGERERNEYDIGGREGYDVDIDDDRYQDPLAYDSYERHQDQYAWEQQHRASSERISVGSYLERRQHVGNDSHVRVRESDLRHQLSKHKKPNGLRSVISREHTRVMHVQGRLGPHGDRQCVSEHDKALSSRLRGRIKLPENSSSPNNRDITRGRLGIASQIGRIEDKRKGRSEDSYSNGWKNNRGPDLRRDDVRDDNEAGFAGPKSLSELKNRKIDEPIRPNSDYQKPLGKRKHPSVVEGHLQSVDSLDFDGPKSLEEILKRKRGIKSSIVKDRGHKDLDSSTDKEVNDFIISSHKNEDAPQSLTTMIKEGEHIEDRADLDTEANGKKDEGYDYEQTGEDDYEYYIGENGDGVDEYVEDEDDDDDFAKKMGLMQN